MLRRIFSVVMFILLVISMLTLSFYIQPVKASGTIYIRADGSIDPPDAPISTVDNVTYTLTGNILSDADGIVVERDSIVVDGADYALLGPRNEPSKGVDLSGRFNVTIKNTNIKHFSAGILFHLSSNNIVITNNITAGNGNNVWLDASSNNTISGNNITAADFYGIVFVSSSNNTISGNTIADNMWGIIVEISSNYNSISENTFITDGILVNDSYQNSVENNTVNGRPLVYLEGVSNYTVDDAGQVILVRCENIGVEGLNLSITDVSVELWETNSSTISGNTITGNHEAGIELYSSSNNTISGNNITDDYYNGIRLDNSSNNSISGNTIAANGNEGIWLFLNCDYTSISGNNITSTGGIGIHVYSSSHARIFGNNITNNVNGIWLDTSSNNTISGNNIANNGGGIHIDGSSNNTISGNNIAANSAFGIAIESMMSVSKNNTIYHNNFINNTNQAYNDALVNVFWDNGYPSGGNYWSDYNGTDLYGGLYQNETGSDGIGDTQYFIGSNNTDKYPLMNLWVRLLGDINGDRIVDIYDAILLANAYNSIPGKANWNPNADMNGDNIVDIYDAIMLANHFNQHYP